jgi:hypothetical protein
MFREAASFDEKRNRVFISIDGALDCKYQLSIGLPYGSKKQISLVSRALKYACLRLLSYGLPRDVP